MYPLPPYARRIEYLESTGTQYVDTGVNAQTTLSSKIVMSATTAAGSIFGVHTSSRLFCNMDANYIQLGTGNGTQGTSTSVGNQIAVGTKFTLETTQGSGGSPRIGIRINGGSWFSSTAPFNFDLGTTLLMFARRRTDSIDSYSKIKIYSVEFYIDGQMVRSFIPCRILDTGYLWDEVEGKFYGNSGAGSFVLGTDIKEGVLPTRLNPFGIGRRMVDIKKIEYIEANTDGGTAQYIDTLVPVTTDAIVETEWTQTDTAIQQRLFGVNDGGEKRFALYVNNDGKWAVNTGTSAGGAMTTVTRRDYVGSFNLGTGVCTINGTSRSNGGAPFDSANTIPIFARKNAGTTIYAEYPATMQLKSFKITQGGKPAFDGTPVRVGSVGWLLDKVSGQLFGNLGTGNFVLGSDV